MPLIRDNFKDILNKDKENKTKDNEEE